MLSNATFTLDVFYDRHAACMRGVDVGQSSVDPVLSGIDVLRSACISLVKYAYCEGSVHARRRRWTVQRRPRTAQHRRPACSLHVVRKISLV